MPVRKAARVLLGQHTVARAHYLGCGRAMIKRSLRANFRRLRSWPGGVAKVAALVGWAGPYVVATLAVLVGWAVLSLTSHLYGDAFTFVPFYFAALVAAWYGGLKPALLATSSGFLVATWWYLTPGTFSIQGRDDTTALVVYLGTCGAVGVLCELLHANWRRAEQMKDRLSITLSSIGDAVMVTDRQSRIRSMNSVAELLTGQTSSQAVGQSLQQVLRIVHESTRLPANNLAIHVMQSGCVTEMDDDSLLVDGGGREIPVDGSAAPIRDDKGAISGAVLVLRDATQKRRFHRALAENEERFRNLANSAPMMIWMSDGAGGYTWVNRAWLDFTGRTLAQELGSGWTDGIHSQDRDSVVQNYAGALRTGREFRLEFRLRHHDGHYRWIVDQGIPLSGSEQRQCVFIGSAMDIHDRKLAEEALREADRRKDEFIATLAHELRNPLAVIRYASELLKIPGQTDQQVRVPDVIERQVSHVIRLIDDLLDVARIARGKLQLQKEHFDARQVVSRVVMAVRPTFDKRKQSLHVAVPPEELSLLADPARLEQILENLLINASKYTPDGGQAWIRAARDDGDVVFEVRDNGMGIARNMLGRVFAPFSQLQQSSDRSQGGLGLGLALVAD